MHKPRIYQEVKGKEYNPEKEPNNLWVVRCWSCNKLLLKINDISDIDLYVKCTRISCKAYNRIYSSKPDKPESKQS